MGSDWSQANTITRSGFTHATGRFGAIDWINPFLATSLANHNQQNKIDRRGDLQSRLSLHVVGVARFANNGETRGARADSSGERNGKGGGHDQGAPLGESSLADQIIRPDVLSSGRTGCCVVHMLEV